MNLNSNKCHIISFYRYHLPLTTFDYNFPVNQIKDLEIVLDRLKKLGFLKRFAYDFTDTTAIKNFYSTLLLFSLVFILYNILNR